MTTASRVVNIDYFVEHLAECRDAMLRMYPHREGWAHQNLYAMMLDLGTPRVGPLTLPDHVEEGVPRHCYENAHEAALEYDLIYVEGLALLLGVPVQHAWCETRDGQVIDPTWSALRPLEITEAYYIGVRFSLTFKLTHTLRVQHYGIFAGDDVGDVIERGFIFNDNGLVIGLGNGV